MYLFLFGTTTQKTEETDSHGSLPHCQSVRQRMGIVSNTTSSVRYQSTVRKHRQFCREEEAILIVQTPKQEKDSNLYSICSLRVLITSRFYRVGLGGG